MSALKTLIEQVKTASDEDRALLLAALGLKNEPKKTKKAPTNSEGPAAWNLFVKETQKTMAAAAGVDASSMDAAAFKKLASAKDSGFGWQAALKEASRRKAAAEGVPAEKKTEKAEKTKKTVAPKPVPAPKPAADAAAKKEFEELNLAEIEIDGKSYYIQQDCLEVYEIESPWKIGDRLGVYDIESESIDTTQ